MWSCTHFRHPTDEQLGHADIFFSDYYNLQSVYFELNSLFLNEIKGTVVLTDLNPDNFMQFTADNIDINDSLLDGKDTFHATQVPGWQRSPDKTKHLASLRPAERTTLVIPEALCGNSRQLILCKTKVSRNYRTY